MPSDHEGLSGVIGFIVSRVLCVGVRILGSWEERWNNSLHVVDLEMSEVGKQLDLRWSIYPLLFLDLMSRINEMTYRRPWITWFKLLDTTIHIRTQARLFTLINWTAEKEKVIRLICSQKDKRKAVQKRGLIGDRNPTVLGTRRRNILGNLSTTGNVRVKISMDH